MDPDSENDSDYVPPKDDDGSETEGRASKRARTNAPLEALTSSEATDNKKGGDEIYAQFKASLTAPSQPTHTPAPHEVVKIVKRYRFAGEEVTEVKEVPADSDEAKKWPQWTPSADASAQAPAGDPSTSQAGLAASAAVTSATSAAPVKPPAKRSGPRKAKSKLADIPSSKKEPIKKLTTLDKSAMDWRAHVEGESSQPIKEELDANRRGGGYLEKVEFLQRVEARKEEVLDASKGKRRR
ncbi:hypothetical protein K466DRAFT_598555 [Polyporus arcularius HHB13444]|uniref:SWR1-complex protein 5 n=1 Tax=Polyporus arcularius HHB13444 TaxID=1314778 RepID=A0A5C3PHZ2_9APHY|nr:hypothetical protein K466DRAFT_598555 [Polyporus arcularius HHB13444]